MYDELFDRYITPLAPIPASIQPAGKPKSPISALLFDVYGTLFISRSGDAGSEETADQVLLQLSDLMNRYGIAIPVDTLISRFGEAISSTHTDKRRMGIDYPEVSIDQIWMSVLHLDRINLARRFALEYELIVNPVYPMPHMKDLLVKCKTSGVRMGIISNAQFYTPLIFERFCGGIPEKLGFDPRLILYSYRLGVAKPSQVPFRIAADRLASSGIHPKNALYIGNDMLNDVTAAHVVGFQTALFAGDARSLQLRKDDPRCKGIKPDMVATELSQIIDYLP